jgi:hypothetical protein
MLLRSLVDGERPRTITVAIGESGDFTYAVA